MQLALFYKRRWAIFYVPITLFAILFAWILRIYVFPMPSHRIAFVSNDVLGIGSGYTQRYGTELARLGLELYVVNAANSLDVLRKLDASSRTADHVVEDQKIPSGDFGFASGLASRNAPSGVEALAVVGRQPVWLFSRLPDVMTLSQIKGSRISVAGRGTVGRAMFDTLLDQVNLQESDIHIAELGFREAANELIAGTTDGALMIARADAPEIRELLHARGVHLVGMENIKGLLAREPLLRPYLLAQGSIELQADIPSRDVELVTTQAHMVIRKNLHPAIQRALLDAARDIHEIPGFMQHRAEFPSMNGIDFTPSSVAKQMQLGEKPWLEELLPFGVAQRAEFLLYAVIPIFAVTLAILTFIPRLFSWKVNEVLRRHYGELKFLEQKISTLEPGDKEGALVYLRKLDTISSSVEGFEVPNRFADRWFTLRVHLATAKDKLYGLQRNE